MFKKIVSALLITSIILTPCSTSVYAVSTTVTEETKNAESTNKNQYQLTSPTLYVETVDSSHLLLSWDNISNIATYCLYRSTSKNGEYESIGSTKKLTYKDKGLDSETTYYYKIYAITSTNIERKQSDFSNIAMGKTEKIVIKAPKISSSAINTSQVKITWNEISNAGIYDVYKASSKNGEYKKIASVKDVSYISKGLKSNTTYYYKVKARKTVNGKSITSKFSNITKSKTKKAYKQKTIDEFIAYLNSTYTSVETPMGVMYMSHKAITNEHEFFPYDYWIMTNYTGVNPFDIKYSIKYTDEQKEKTLDTLCLVQYVIYAEASKYLENKKIEGGFYNSWYKYPTIMVDLQTSKFLTWRNYDTESAYSLNYSDSKLSDFNWNDFIDDYKFNTKSIEQLVEEYS